MPVKSLGEMLRSLREGKGLLLREVAAILAIDPSLLSKIERGTKNPTRDHILKMARIYDCKEKDLLVAFLSNMVVNVLSNEEFANDAIIEAKKKINVLQKRTGK